MPSPPKKQPKSARSCRELDRLLFCIKENRVLTAELGKLVFELEKLNVQVRKQSRVLKFPAAQ